MLDRQRFRLPATGLPPALYASSLHLAEIPGGELVASGRHLRMRGNALVIAQVGICTLVLAGLGLCERSLYYPLGQHHRGYTNVVVRTTSDPRRWSAALTQAMRSLGLKVLFQPATLNDWMDFGIALGAIPRQILGGMVLVSLPVASIAAIPSLRSDPIESIRHA